MAIFKFPLEGTSNYKGKIKFKAIREDYQTILDKAIAVNENFSQLPGSGIDPRISPGAVQNRRVFYNGATRSGVQPSTRVSLDTAELYLPCLLYTSPSPRDS